MGFIGYLIVGLIAGFLARALVPGRDAMGLIATLILGLAGSLVGGFLVQMLFNDNTGVGLIGSVVGAILVLLAYKAITGRNKSAA